MPPSQIINGGNYAPYTPQWYQAMDADAVRRSGVQGTAQGTGEANYWKSLSPSLMGLWSSLGLGGSGAGSGFQTGSIPNEVSIGSGGGSTATSPIATIAPLDFTKANAAAFATAKDQAAQTAQASMRGLQQALSARGLTGGGYQAGQIGTTLAREANTIGQASRDEARNEANLQAQADEANLGAQVTQRGQDISRQEADAERAARLAEASFSGGIAQRGQDIGVAESAANRAADLAKFRASQSLAILRNVMGQPNINVPYVY